MVQEIILLANMLQILGSPNWAIQTLFAGQPEFKTLTPYIPKGMSLRHLGLFMNKTFNGRLNEERIKAIRDKWKGKLVLKGVATEEDTEKAIDREASKMSEDVPKPSHVAQAP